MAQHPGSKLGTTLHPPTARDSTLQESAMRKAAMIDQDSRNRNHQPYSKAEAAFREDYEKVTRILVTDKGKPAKFVNKILCISESSAIVRNYL